MVLRGATAQVAKANDDAPAESQLPPCSCADDFIGAQTKLKPDRLRVINDAVAALERAATVLRVESLAEEWGELDVESGIDLHQEVRRFETRLIKHALHEADGNQSRAARLLGLNKTTLHEKIKRYGID